MARIVRQTLDLTLYTIRKTRPIISNGWNSIKSSLATTKISGVVNNPVMSKAEILTDQAMSFFEDKLIWFRNQQLPAELKYLEKEIEKVKEKIAESGVSANENRHKVS